MVQWAFSSFYTLSLSLHVKPQVLQIGRGSLLEHIFALAKAVIFLKHF